LVLYSYSRGICNRTLYRRECARISTKVAEMKEQYNKLDNEKKRLD